MEVGKEAFASQFLPEQDCREICHRLRGFCGNVSYRTVVLIAVIAVWTNVWSCVDVTELLYSSGIEQMGN
jgi:hypothetical protein